MLSKDITQPFAFKKPVQFDVVDVVILSIVNVLFGKVTVFELPDIADAIKFKENGSAVPPRYKLLNVFEFEPRSIEFVTQGDNETFNAVLARLSRALVAPVPIALNGLEAVPFPVIVASVVTAVKKPPHADT